MFIRQGRRASHYYDRLARLGLVRVVRQGQAHNVPPARTRMDASRLPPPPAAP